MSYSVLTDFLCYTEEYVCLSELSSPTLVLDLDGPDKDFSPKYSHSRTIEISPIKQVNVTTQTSCTSPSISSRQCSECNQMFVSHKGMKQHMAKAHMNLNKQTKCPLCFKAYKHRFAVRFHIKQVHDKATRVECPQCKKMLYNKYILTKHMESHAVTLSSA